MRKLFASLAGKSPYEVQVYLFLSFVRFLSFALAVFLLFSIPEEPPTDLRALIIVSSAGIYTILKVLFRFRLWQMDIVTYMVLLADLAIGVTLVLLTGGIGSPFLFYSLLPVITAALFFEVRITLFIAAVSSLNVFLAHTVLAAVNPSFNPIMENNSLSIVLAYSLFCFLIATITYPSNLNVYRRIESRAIIDERRRLRQEIHDNIAQVLGYLRTKIELLKKNLPSSDEKLLAELEEMHQLVSESSAEIREAIDSLDIEVRSFSLIKHLTDYIKQFEESTGSKVELTLPKELGTLHPSGQLQLLRIAQEALHNVRKHAKATQVWVEVENTVQSVELVVKDNGRGFSPSEQKGTGLKIMEERARGINGTLTVTSSPGGGTEIRVTIPRR